ncbi:stress response transcriptional regulator NmlR [Streptococcus periodonticum]|uniref:MerR family transcriptional regulator n=1 Tax=Streptococcus periodonticum TaxID=2490633 RepID=A0A3S9MTB8_9STRE|nr:stress response transcriptional regulator NmlR [Streptococcus periodonticum]AZQ42423.1 MerR family transcriptional regulator [Streptococcus periodonticum]
MNIKKVSELTGITADTIRYYERIGFIPPVPRNQAGIRDFSQHDIDILEFVRCFKKAGMSVESLIDYIGLLDKGEVSISARLAILQDEKEKLEERVNQLQQTLYRLNYKIENYKKKIVPIEKELFEEKGDE